MASKTRALSGKDATFLIGQYDYSDIFSMVGLSTTRDKAEVTVLNDGGKAYVPGHFDGTLRLSGIFSAEEDAVLQNYVSEASAPIGCTLILGAVRGDRAKLSEIVTSEYGIDTPVDDKASISGSGQASGLMHNGYALSNVGAKFAVAANDHGINPSSSQAYIDLGGTDYKRFRLHLHITSTAGSVGAVKATIHSGSASGTITTDRNGASGATITITDGRGFYTFEYTNDGSDIDRYWKVELNVGGTVNAANYLNLTAAYAKGKEG